MGVLLARHQTINLKGNYLNSFSSHLGKLVAVKSLNLASNFISILNSAILVKMSALTVREFESRF
jgi:hypothetical protein